MASVFGQIKELWTNMPVGGRVSTIVGAVAAIGLIGAVVYFGSQPDYRVLFTDLKPADTQSIIDKLKAANVPYNVTNGGTTIQVPSDKVSELRLQMAGEGALSGGHVGFDLFDKTSFGATDFAQQVNYRRAVEGELAKTIEGMDEVESARVHVTPKKDSIFTDKEDSAKASVMVKVKQNKALSSERTASIVSLVASSIEGLDASNISVMDTSGRLLAAAENKSGTGSSPSGGGFNTQLQAKQKFEAESAGRIIALLEPVVGGNRVRADVSADVDFNQVEQSEEKYNPQSQVVRSQQTSQELRNNPNLNAGGPAGARSNNPTKPVATTGTATNTATGDQRTTSAVNYEIDKTVKRTVSGGGHVNRLSVSVVVDHKLANGVEVARTSDEVKQIQDLVTAAVGIDTNRGDTIVVQTMPFDKPQMEEAPAPNFLEKNKQYIPTAMKYGALVLISLLLLLFVVRPAHKALKAASANIAEEKKLLDTQLEEPDRRRTEVPKQLAENTELPANPMMTVAEIEARMDGSEPPAGNRENERLESIRRQIAAQSVTDTETVVSTLRGWIRENA